jgi:diguanylate cyclase (GGDEF)-like protein/PAS domain S-box-containing protein
MEVARSRRRVAMIGLAGAVALMSTIGFLVHRHAGEEAQAAEWVEHSHVVIETLVEVGASIAVAEAGVRGFAATKESVHLVAVGPALAEAVATARRARELTRDNDSQQRRLDALEPLLDERLQMLRARLEAMEAGRLEPGSTHQAAMLSQAIRAALGAMIGEERLLLARRGELRRQKTARLRVLSVAGVLSALALMLGATALLMREMTRGLRVQAELRTRQVQLDAVIEGTTDVIFIKDLQDRFLLLNSAAARTLGRPREEILGRRLAELVSPEVAAIAARTDQEVLSSGVARTFEQVVPVGGVNRTFLSSKSPYRDSTQKIIGIVSSSRDITERRQAEEARLSEVNLHLSLGELLQASRVLDEAYEVIAQLAPRFFREESGAVYLFHASRDHLEAHVSWGADAGVTTFGPDDCWALRRGQPHFLTDDKGGLPCKHARGEGARAMLCVPLLAAGEMLGTLHLCSRESIDEAVRKRADLVSEQIAMALANLKLREKLRNQSIRDALTGLFNRRYTEETLVRELHRAERQRASLSILAIDVDHFKRFNDSFGHEAGDKVLRAIGTFLLEQTRGGDVASRMGGEELLVMLPGAGPDDARSKADQLRAGIKQLVLNHMGAALGKVTISVGVAAYPHHARRAEELLRIADAALYQAKHQGRDRVVVAEAAEPAAAGAPAGNGRDAPVNTQR